MGSRWYAWGVCKEEWFAHDCADGMRTTCGTNNNLGMSYVPSEIDHDIKHIHKTVPKLFVAY